MYIGELKIRFSISYSKLLLLNLQKCQLISLHPVHYHLRMHQCQKALRRRMVKPNFMIQVHIINA